MTYCFPYNPRVPISLFWFREHWKYEPCREKPHALVFPKKIGRKPHIEWQPPTTRSQLLGFLECKVCQCCRSTEGSSSFPHEKSWKPHAGWRQLFLSPPQIQEGPLRVCSMGVGIFQRSGVQMSFLTLSTAILFFKCKKVWSKKVLFTEVLIITILILPLLLTSSMLNTNFISLGVNTQSEDWKKKLCQRCKLLKTLGFLSGNIWKLLLRSIILNHDSIFLPNHHSLASPWMSSELLMWILVNIPKASSESFPTT